MVLFTSAAVVITGVAPSLSAMSFVSLFAPPRCPESVLITNLALSSITITAGSVFLSFRCGEINLITAPYENKQTSASFDLNNSTIFVDVLSLYQLMLVLPSENLLGANTSQEENFSFSSFAILMPFLVMAKIAIFSIR